MFGLIIKITIIVIIIILFAGFCFCNYKKKKEAEYEAYRHHLEEREKRRKEEEWQEKLRIEKEEKRKHIEEQRRKEEQIQQRRLEVVNGWRDEFKKQVDSLPSFEIVLSGEKHNRNNSIFFEDYCKNLTKSTPLNKIKDFVAVDVETTGLKTGGNDIIQLSAVKFRNFKPVEKFDTYIKPRKSIPPEATEINHITDEMVENAPQFYQIIDSFNRFIEDLPLIAHNAPFDMKHLYVNGLDSVVNKTIYDTLGLSRRIMKDEYSYKLTDICEVFNIYISDAHNAVYDSYAAGQLFVNLVAERREILVKELLD